jgi:hypothetical protein
VAFLIRVIIQRLTTVRAENETTPHDRRIELASQYILLVFKVDPHLIQKFGVNSMNGKAPKFTKNVAQAPLSSPIHALRDLRKQGRPVNTIDQQVQLYQKLFEHLEPRYLSLIANFEMFSPVLKQPRLVKWLKKEGKIYGTYVVAETLCNAAFSIVTGCSKMVARVIPP